MKSEEAFRLIGELDDKEIEKVYLKYLKSNEKVDNIINLTFQKRHTQHA